MFQLELIELLNELRKTESKLDFLKIKDSISNLIDENKNEYAKFLDSQDIDEWTRKNLDDCEDIILHKKEEIKPEGNDFEVLKTYYSTWLEEYTKNNKVPTQKCEDIVNEIINFYILNRYDVLEKLFEIKDTPDFEDFKIMIKNYIRKYYALKIDEYYKSDEFNEKGFFEKRKKRKQIIKYLNEIGKYNFSKDDFNEVINS